MAKEISLIDTHCHLDAAEFDADRDALIAAARQGIKVGAGGTECPVAGTAIAEPAANSTTATVGTIVIPSIERANFAAVISLCREYPGCVAAYGIHPMYVARARPADLEVLRETLSRETAVAVGEIGLDHFIEPRDEAQQQFYFVAQLKLAQACNLPVLLHVRKAIDPILKLLRQHPVRGGIAHAFNGSRQQADEFIKLGFKLGFGGAMTYPGSKRIRALAASLPLDSIVLETDAPDIPPAWQAGGRNTPADLLPIAAVLAELRGMTVEEVAVATTANVRGVLGMVALPSPGV